MTDASQLLHTFSNASSIASNLGPASPPGAWGGLTTGGQRRGTQLGTLDERASSAAGAMVWESVCVGADRGAGIAAWLPRDVWTLSVGLGVKGADVPGAAQDGVESSVAAVATAGAGSSFAGLLHYGIAPRALQSLQPDDLWSAPWASEGGDSDVEEGDARVRVSASVGPGVGGVAGVSPFASAASAEAVVAAAGAGTRRGTRMVTGGGAGGAAVGTRGGSGGGAGGGLGGRSPPMSTSNSMLSDQAPHTSLFKVWKCGSVGSRKGLIIADCAHCCATG